MRAAPNRARRAQPRAPAWHTAPIVAAWPDQPARAAAPRRGSPPS